MCSYAFKSTCVLAYMYAHTHTGICTCIEKCAYTCTWYIFTAACSMPARLICLIFSWS